MLITSMDNKCSEDNKNREKTNNKRCLMLWDIRALQKAIVIKPLCTGRDQQWDGQNLDEKNQSWYMWASNTWQSWWVSRERRDYLIHDTSPAC